MGAIGSPLSYTSSNLQPQQDHAAQHYQCTRRPGPSPGTWAQYAHVDRILRPRTSSSAAGGGYDGLNRPLKPLDTLKQLVPVEKDLEHLMTKHPSLLAQPLEPWLDFLYAYGVSDVAVGKLFVRAPEIFTTSTVYDAGCAILFFKSLGWRDRDVLDRIVPLYPELLAKKVSHDFLPILSHLYQLGCSTKDVRLLAWEFPRIFSKDYRRHVRKFQYLGVYGLSRQSRTPGL